MHVQSKLPGRSRHEAETWQLSSPSAHSSMFSQLRPSPRYPALQAQLKPGLLSLHVAFASQSSVPSAHSLISQLVPLPVDGGRHRQLNPPEVLLQSAWGEQLWVPSRHSSMSWQPLRPSPWKPDAHSQSKLPGRFWQLAFGAQTDGLLVHSSTSTQDVPVLSYPALHRHSNEPLVLMQVPPGAQGEGWELHSLMS